MIETHRLKNTVIFMETILSFVLSGKPKFNGLYSKTNLPKIKNGAHVINFDPFKSIGTH